MSDKNFKINIKWYNAELWKCGLCKPVIQLELFLIYFPCSHALGRGMNISKSWYIPILARVVYGLFRNHNSSQIIRCCYTLLITMHLWFCLDCAILSHFDSICSTKASSHCHGSLPSQIFQSLSNQRLLIISLRNYLYQLICFKNYFRSQSPQYWTKCFAVLTLCLLSSNPTKEICKSTGVVLMFIQL